MLNKIKKKENMLEDLEDWMKVVIIEFILIIIYNFNC